MVLQVRCSISRRAHGCHPLNGSCWFGAQSHRSDSIKFPLVPSYFLRNNFFPIPEPINWTLLASRLSSLISHLSLLALPTSLTSHFLFPSPQRSNHSSPTYPTFSHFHLTTWTVRRRDHRTTGPPDPPSSSLFIPAGTFGSG
jgi:hypothetical protein